MINQLKQILTFLLHASPEALLETTVSALVPLILVNLTNSREAALVQIVSTDTSPEKAFTPIAREGPVVLSSSPIHADGASSRTLGRGGG